MAHDVFISCASDDKLTADAVCAKLEEKGIRCWVAPRDVLPGEDWGEAIVTAIDESRLMVLVFSVNSNGSEHVKNEVLRTVDQGKPVLPFRVEEVEPSGSLALHLSGRHWLDAWRPPLEKHLVKLAETTRLLLSRLDGREAPAEEAAVVKEVPRQEKATEQRAVPPPPVQGEREREVDEVAIADAVEKRQEVAAPKGPAAQTPKQAAPVEEDREQEALDRQLVGAVRAGDVEEVRELLGHGAAPNVDGGQGFPLLWEAVRGDRVEMVQLLLNHGADVNARGQHGDPALLTAIDGELIGKEAELAELLVARGADLNAQATDGRSPLGQAVRWNLPQGLALLLEHAADPNVKGHEDTTPLHSAASKGNSQFIKLLVERGADVNAKNRRGEGPLHSAAFGGNAESIELLVQHGADVNARNNKGETPRAIAVYWGRTDVAELLKKHGGTY